ncbi:MAG: HutD family protein [Rhizobacter sp.]
MNFGNLNVTAEPELIDLTQCPSTAWRNGAGSMRLVATHPIEGGENDFDWRISVAEVAQDSPFSAFPGYDRCIALLGGNGMVLVSAEDGLNHRLESPLQPFYFPGEARIQARLIDGPLHNLSVLARRGRYCITLTALVTPTRFSLAAGTAPLLIQCLSGELQIELDNQKSLRLRSGALALWRFSSPGMHLVSHSAHMRALLVRLGAPST